MLSANETSFGKRVIPGYKFDAADVIVSFAADFLGTWISPVEYAAAYAKNRKIDKELAAAKMSRHYQFETGMSMTGSNADHRTPIKPSENGAALLALYVALGGSGVSAPKLANNIQKAIETAAADLKAAGAKSLVVCGANDINAQTLTNAINALLGNVGTTIDFGNYSNQAQGSDAENQACADACEQFLHCVLSFWNRSAPAPVRPGGGVVTERLCRSRRCECAPPVRAR